mgnify:CR=1 FL=1
MELFFESTLNQYLPIEIVHKIMTHKYYLERQYCLWKLHQELKDQVVDAVIRHHSRGSLAIEIVDESYFDDDEYQHYLATLDEMGVVFSELCSAIDLPLQKLIREGRVHHPGIRRLLVLLDGTKSYGEIVEEAEEEVCTGCGIANDECVEKFREEFDEAGLTSYKHSSSGWNQYCPDCIYDDSHTDESDDESDEGYEIYFDGEPEAWFPRKEDLREFFDDCVASMEEYGQCLPSYAPNHKPSYIDCYGDEEVEDWEWRSE